jgi:F0F1-type ATP synthase assembly protein I
MDKLDQLNKKIRDYKEKHKAKDYTKKTLVMGSLNIAIEIVAAVAVGLLIGFYLDRFFDTKIVFKIVCLLLAFVASLVNIYRTIDKR